jgi:2-polyprenyl-3-methyl-5-hydroxy-6-metoxy-1,4-benzoquinol methylase
MICRICQSNKEHKEYKVKETTFGLGEEFLYFQCSDCGCLQIKDIPKEMSRYYPSDYYSIADAPEKYSLIGHMIGRARTRYAIFNKGIVGKLLYSRFPHSALRSLSHVNVTTESRILDVGCGSGNTLYSMRLYGFKNLLGIDPYIDHDIAYANGLKVLKKDIFEVEGKFEVIMFHHSFEHIDKPVETVKAITNLLMPGGICIIRIPVVDSWAWEEYGTSWFQIDAPRHFFLHSKKSMDVLAKKAGLKINKIVYDSRENQFWISEQYKKDTPQKAENSYFVNCEKSIFTKSQMMEFKRKAQKLNLEQKGDQAVFYLSAINTEPI